MGDAKGEKNKEASATGVSPPQKKAKRLKPVDPDKVVDGTKVLNLKEGLLWCLTQEGLKTADGEHYPLQCVVSTIHS